MSLPRLEVSTDCCVGITHLARVDWAVRGRKICGIESGGRRFFRSFVSGSTSPHFPTK